MQVVDRCAARAEFDLDFSSAAFTDLAENMTIGLHLRSQLAILLNEGLYWTKYDMYEDMCRKDL